MTKFVGGRGKRAPYQTQTVRVPAPLVDLVMDLSEQYRETLTVPVMASHHTPPLDSALETSKAILSQRKNARITVEKLLTALYGEPVKLNL
jgi:hypothetical protein